MARMTQTHWDKVRYTVERCMTANAFHLPPLNISSLLQELQAHKERTSHNVVRAWEVIRAENAELINAGIYDFTCLRIGMPATKFEAVSGSLHDRKGNFTGYGYTGDMNVENEEKVLIWRRNFGENRFPFSLRISLEALPSTEFLSEENRYAAYQWAQLWRDVEIAKDLFINLKKAWGRFSYGLVKQTLPWVQNLFPENNELHRRLKNARKPNTKLLDQRVILPPMVMAHLQKIEQLSVGGATTLLLNDRDDIKKAATTLNRFVPHFTFR